MDSLRTIVLIALLPLLLFCAACDTRTPQPPARPSPVEDDPFVKLSSTVAEERSEPNWKDRYASHKQDLMFSFAAPRTGQTVAIKLQSGTEREGTLTALSENEATLAFDIGEVSYPRAALSIATRAELFAGDYAHMGAMERVQRERGEVQSQTQVKHTSAAASEKNSGAPFNDPGDRSVWQVKEFLRNTLKDPDTIHYKEWSPVMKTEKGYQVVCTYQARAGSFGMVTEKKVFHMTHSGHVTTASAVRQNLQQ